MITRRQLGKQRLEGVLEVHAQVQAMLVFAMMTVMATPAARYSDDALDQMREDAGDVVAAALAFRAYVERLADEWRAQREEVAP